MSEKRCILHKTKLEEFKQWLIDNGIPFKPGKGPYQVLQVFVESCNSFQIVVLKDIMTEHYSINEKLIPVVREFLKDTRKEK